MTLQQHRCERLPLRTVEAGLGVTCAALVEKDEVALIKDRVKPPVEEVSGLLKRGGAGAAGEMDDGVRAADAAAIGEYRQVKANPARIRVFPVLRDDQVAARRLVSGWD
jgi:hypothetical protein